MRILLDECVPRPLKRDREEGFDTLATVDRNLQFQQNIPAAGMVVVVLYARTNRIPELRQLMPAVRDILATAKPGTVYRPGV